MIESAHYLSGNEGPSSFREDDFARPAWLLRRKAESEVPNMFQEQGVCQRAFLHYGCCVWSSERRFSEGFEWISQLRMFS